MDPYSYREHYPNGKLFVDMDGVLADFDTHYINTVGPLPPKYRTDLAKEADINWCALEDAHFFAHCPPMPDMHVLWKALAPLKPIVITGCPETGRERAEQNKRGWIAKHLGADIEVRCVRSSEKYLHAAPGDILIDDWEKYKGKWIEAGGIWITHKNALQTIGTLRIMEVLPWPVGC